MRIPFALFGVMLLALLVGDQRVFAAGGNDALADLRKDHLVAAKDWWDGLIREYESEDEAPAKFHAASVAWKNAAYDLATNMKERLAALTDHEKRMDAEHKKVKALYDAKAKGGEASVEAATRYWLIEAKLWVFEEKARP